MHRHIQIQGQVHKKAFRQVQVQTHKTEDGGENSNMHSLFIKRLHGEMLFFPQRDTIISELDLLTNDL